MIPKRVAIVVSHPIQHFVPFYRRISNNPALNVKVFYASTNGAKPYWDTKFGQMIKWSGDLLDGYSFEFLPGADDHKSLSFWSVKNKIRKRLRSFAPDCVIIYGYSNMIMLNAFLYCKCNNVPVIMISDSELLQNRTDWKMKVKKIILPVFFRHISGFLTVGDNNEEFYTHYGVDKNKMFRSPFTIDEVCFKKVRLNIEVDKIVYREKWGIDKEAIVILFVGKMTASKRPLDIIYSLYNIEKSIPESKKVVALYAGNGELKDTVTSLGNSFPKNISVRYLGFVNTDVLPYVYAVSDILVHPSARDHHPLSTVEATFMGLPIIVSDRVGSAGPTDTVRPGVNGFVYPCGDVISLSKYLLHLIEDQDTRTSMGRSSLYIAEKMSMCASEEGLIRAINYSTSQQ